MPQRLAGAQQLIIVTIANRISDQALLAWLSSCLTCNPDEDGFSSHNGFSVDELDDASQGVEELDMTLGLLDATFASLAM